MKSIFQIVIYFMASTRCICMTTSASTNTYQTKYTHNENIHILNKNSSSSTFVKNNQTSVETNDNRSTTERFKISKKQTKHKQLKLKRRNFDPNDPEFQETLKKYHEDFSEYKKENYQAEDETNTNDEEYKAEPNIPDDVFPDHLGMPLYSRQAKHYQRFTKSFEAYNHKFITSPRVKFNLKHFNSSSWQVTRPELQLQTLLRVPDMDSEEMWEVGMNGGTPRNRIESQSTTSLPVILATPHRMTVGPPLRNFKKAPSFARERPPRGPPSAIPTEPTEPTLPPELTTEAKRVTRRRRRTLPPEPEYGHHCDHLVHNCLLSFRTGKICGKTLHGKYVDFDSYCYLRFVNCMENVDLWQIAYVGECYSLKKVDDYLLYPYLDDYFLDNYYVVDFAS